MNRFILGQLREPQDLGPYRTCRDWRHRCPSVARAPVWAHCDGMLDQREVRALAGFLRGSKPKRAGRADSIN